MKKIGGLDLLIGFREVYSLAAKFPNDLVLFNQCTSGQLTESAWFAVALEANSSKPQNSHADELVLYKYQDASWVDMDRVGVAGGVRLVTEQIGDSVYIVVAEYHAENVGGSSVFQVNSTTNRLQFVQMLYTSFPSNVVMWKRDDIDAFVAIAVSENAPKSNNRYSTQSPVYCWIGSHFNMIDTLPTYNPRALTQFNIHNSMFIAVANFQNDFGDTAIDSSIFRFNQGTKKFSLYQNLPTEAAVDLKYFCFQGFLITESFLIYASAFRKDEEGNKDYNTASVVYKLSEEEYFVPFQALQVYKVTSWLPVRHVEGTKETLILVAASDQGITSFQYDGWRFVSIGVLYDHSTFGPGVKSISVFYHNNQTLISAANKESDGHEMNVVSPVFKHQTRVEELQQHITSWEQHMSRQLVEAEAKVTTLLQTAQTSPSINDQVIELGSEVVFHYAEIDHVETYATRVGENDTDLQVGKQLESLYNQLDILQQQIGPLNTRIGLTSIHTHTVYEDILESSADIFCTHACRVIDLEVAQMNGENLQQFLKNTVNISEPVVFKEEIIFEHLALMDPLDTRMINGHDIDTVIDWSKDVYIDHGLKVEGDVKLESDLRVRGTVAGVSISANTGNEDKFVEDGIVLFSKFVKTLNASQLLLSDGNISQVDFERFSQATLKRIGNQLITESQDFERIETDELVPNGGLYRVSSSVLPSPHVGLQFSCEGKFLSEEEVLSATQESLSIARVSEAGSDIESISLVNGEIIITHDLTFYGTVIIENGSLTSEDFVDPKYNVSAEKLMEYGIRLNQSVIDKHFEFSGSFKAPNLNIDTLNGVDLTSLVEENSSQPLVLSGQKVFRDVLTLNGTVQVTGTVNGINLTQLTDSENRLGVVPLASITVLSVNSSSVDMNGTDWHQLVSIRDDGSVYLKHLQVEEDVTVSNVMVRGHINNVYLEDLLQDTVYKDGNAYLVTGNKNFINHLKISNLTLKILNDIAVETIQTELFWKNRLSKSKIVRVDNLTYTGELDGIGSNVFGMWLLTEGDQIVWGHQTIASLEAESVHVPPDGTFNGLNIHRLMTEAIFLTDNTTLEHVVFEKPVESHRVFVGGRMSDLQIPEDTVVRGSGGSQQVMGVKQFRGNVAVHGRLQLSSTLSSVDLSAYCQAFSFNHTQLLISGNAAFIEEPNITNSVNSRKWTDLMSHVWFKEDNVNISKPVLINSAGFDNLAVEIINSNVVEERLSKLVSTSQDQYINGTFYIPEVVLYSGLEVSEGAVGGTVQGLKLSSFIKSVMMDGEDQEIWEYADFNHLVIDGVLKSEGLVNGLNLSRDVMLTDVTSNEGTSTLMVNNLLVGELRLPPGAIVSGVDLAQWNSSAVKKSVDNHITGNIVFTSQFDSASGIRVKGLVNGLHFDKDHLMLKKGSQNVTGFKKFSSRTELDIKRLQVEGFLNGIDVTTFYSQQVTPNSNITMSGHNRFVSPMYADRVVLPEMYQGYNLTWLETQLASPLPWTQYHSQLEHMAAVRKMADNSLAARVHNLKHLTRLKDLEGHVLSVFPVKSNNLTVLSAVRLRDNKITLSLLSWNNKDNLFLDMPGSVQKVLKVAPSSVQSVTLPGGELAAYVTSYLPQSLKDSVGNGEIFRLKDNRIKTTKIIGGEPGSILVSFQNYNARTCFIVVTNMCKVYCYRSPEQRARLPSFSCNNITEAVVLTTNQKVYLFGLQSGSQSALIVWKLSGKRFTLVQTLQLFNPVSITATTARVLNIAVAIRHRIGDSHPETVDLYRFSEETYELQLEQSLPSISPKKVLFADLPSGESVLYVASDNPASPLEVFVFRGILGYQLLTVESTLPTPTDIYAVTDHQQNHFVVTTSKQNSCVLQAHFGWDVGLT